MDQRPKLEFKEVNKPMKLTLLFNDPIIGESQYGKYYLYAVKNGDDSKYSYFATEDVHEKIKDLKAGDTFEITKVALHSKAKNKVVTAFDVKLLNNGHKPTEVKTSNNNSDYYSAMEQSFEEAIKLQNRFNGMANVNQIAITLFIQRTKGNHSLINQR
ncbi:MAG: hypothetical protein U5K00_00525 [Melioribacteraceae bacterium]|nr:hypothetical protein [Melioribacteraceae bacterium]